MKINIQPSPLAKGTKLQTFNTTVSSAVHEQLRARTGSAKMEISWGMIHRFVHAAAYPEASQSQNKVRSQETSTVRIWKATSLPLT